YTPARPKTIHGGTVEFTAVAASGEDEVTRGALEGAGAPAGCDELLARGQLGRFRLLDKLGQGGMGAVSRAEDPASGGLVASKVLRGETARRPEALRRFHKEARLLAEVQHPNVANLLEVNEDAGTHYLVLEYVAGRTLGDVLKERGRLDEPFALAVIAEAARGLAEAPERGIVHRDLKPDNIVLVGSGQFAVGSKEEAVPLSDAAAGAPRGSSPPPSSLPTAHCELPTAHCELPTVKVLDFGLARHVVET